MLSIIPRNFKLENISLSDSEENVDRSEKYLLKEYDVTAYLCSTSEPHE